MYDVYASLIRSNCHIGSPQKESNEILKYIEYFILPNGVDACNES